MTAKVKHILSLWLPLLAYMGVMSILSFIPDLARQTAISDKLMHLGEFTVLAFLFIRAFGGGLLTPISLSVYFSSAACSFVYGVLNEAHQAIIPYRHFELLDLASNAGGILIGSALVFLLQRFFGWSIAPQAPTSHHSGLQENR